MNDHYINYAQTLLKKQDVSLQGLRLTLSQEKEQPKIPNGMQIVYCQQRQHWIVVSNIACSKNEIKIFDSVFTSTDAETCKIIVNLFQTTKKS